MPRGGKREGAGRPVGTGRFGEPTAPIRVPLEESSPIIRLNLF